MPPHSLCASSCESNSHPYLVSSPPSLQQPVQSFSLHRPSPTQDMKKIRNAKQLSLNVSATPGQHTANTSHNNSSINGPAKKNTILPLIITPSPLFPPSTPSSTSFSSRRPFTPAPLTSIPRTTVSETKRHSQLLLDDALPTPKLPLPTTGATGGHRSISAYFSDYSLECGVASPYTSEPVCVLPNLYLGAEHNATDVRTLRRLGITFVLNVAIEIAQEEESDTMKSSRRIDRISGGVQYKSLPWTHHQKSLLRDFPTAFRLLDEAMVSHSGKGKALVHCQLGVSRSASLVIAYVMKSQGMGLTEAYDFVKLRSGVISPNMSLMYQLAEFEKTLKNPNWIPSDSASDSASIRSRNSWSSQLDDDEPPYPFSAAFSAAASPDSVPASVSLKLSSDPYMEIPATPSFRQEFCKRPLTPESVEEDHPNTKPFQGPGRMAQPMSLLSSPPASRRNQYSRPSPYQRSPLVSSFTPASCYSSSSVTEASNIASSTPLPLSPKTPTTARFSSLSLGVDLATEVDVDVDMMVPPTPLFQSSFAIPSLSSSPSSSSSTSSSASSVSSFEACSRPSSCSTSSSYFTACGDDEDEFSSVQGGVCSPRNSGTWSSSALTQPALMMSMMTGRRQEVEEPFHEYEKVDQKVKKQKKGLWTGLTALQVITEGATSSSSSSSSVSLKCSSTTSSIHSTVDLVESTDPSAMRAVMSKTASGTDYIFSPRPCTPTHHEARSFGDFYQALCMEGR